MHDRTKEYLDYVTHRLTALPHHRNISREEMRTIVISHSTPEVLLVYANLLLLQKVAGEETTGPSILQRLGILQRLVEQKNPAYVMYDLDKDTFCSPKPNNLQFRPTSIKELGSYLQCNIEILDYSDWKRLKNTGDEYASRMWGRESGGEYMLKYRTALDNIVDQANTIKHTTNKENNMNPKKTTGKLVFTYEGGVTHTAAGVFNVVTGQSKSDNKFFVQYDYETQDHEGNMSKGTITRVVTHHLRKVELVGKENSEVVLDLGYVAPVKQKKHSRTKEEWEAMEKQKEEERIKEHRIHQLKKELAKLQK